jgi:nucleoside 2-deoxyribosyltransferase
MNIYFACSITGGRQDEVVYRIIVDALLEDGHQVPTAILASPEAAALETIVDPVEVYERDTAWIRESDVLIAEVSTPSHGVGYEIGYALNLSRPVICLHREGTAVSKMISGNQDSCLSIFAYENIDEALVFIRERLDEIANM